LREAKRTLLRELVEVEVQREHVNPRFAQQSKLTPGDVLLDELAHLVLAETAGLRDARSLIKRGIRSKVRVESGAGGGDEVNRTGLPGFSAVSLSMSP